MIRVAKKKLKSLWGVMFGGRGSDCSAHSLLRCLSHHQFPHIPTAQPDLRNNAQFVHIIVSNMDAGKRSRALGDDKNDEESSIKKAMPQGSSQEQKKCLVCPDCALDNPRVWLDR